MSDSVTNIVFAGLGGQGVIKASDIMADAAFDTGLDVKKSELHGMSQRGGSVTSDVRFGKNVLSPMIPAGEADFLVVLDATQVDNNKHLLKAGGVMISPDCIDQEKLPGKHSLNVAMLGALSKHLKFPNEVWELALKKSFPEKFHEPNTIAFNLGRNSK